MSLGGRIGAWAGLLGALACCVAGTPALVLEREQLTSGPMHHLFGYIGQSLTIPWSGDGRYVLALETDFHDRLPGAEDAAGVVVIDTENSNRVLPLDRGRQLFVLRVKSKE